MSSPDSLAAYPERVPASTEHPGPVYVRLKDHYAVHATTKSSHPGAQTVLADGAIGVYDAGTPPPTTSSAVVTPVYATPAGGAPAVPTGGVFVRFDDGIVAEARRGELAAAGYEIERVPSYAPNAAWVRAGDIAASLIGIPRLAAIPGVRNVEPEMLRKVARK